MITFILVGLGSIALFIVAVHILSHTIGVRCKNCGWKMEVVREDDDFITYVCPECGSTMTINKKYERYD